MLNLSGDVTAVSAGSEASFAIQDGTLYGWGLNGTGELGNNNSLTPVTVAGLSSGVTLVSGGDKHMLAVKNGGLYAAGDNTYGELGSMSGPSPVQVTGMSSGVTAIAAGDGYSLAVRNGAVYAWGANWHGQLGNGTTSNSSTPVPVTNLSNGVTAVTTSGLDQPGTNGSGILDGTVYSHSLALQNGGVYEWGNFNDGTTSFKLTPELIDPADLNGLVAVYATGASSFALSSDGTVWDWGVNIEGELGLGSGASYSYSTPQHLIPPPGDRFTSLSDQADGDSVLATLAPVPEPIGVPLMAAVGVALLRRRRCRSA